MEFDLIELKFRIELIERTWLGSLAELINRVNSIKFDSFNLINWIWIKWIEFDWIRIDCGGFWLEIDGCSGVYNVTLIRAGILSLNISVSAGPLLLEMGSNKSQSKLIAANQLGAGAGPTNKSLCDLSIFDIRSHFGRVFVVFLYGNFCLVSAPLSVKRHYLFTYFFQSSFRAVF